MTMLAFGVWTGATWILFASTQARRAASIALLSGVLFLPIVTFPIEGFPDLDKLATIALGIGGASLVFDRARWLRMRPRWIDLPMAVWCASPIASSWSNDLGLYNGLSEAFRLVLVWGVPWALGRAYFADLAGLRELAIALIVGALVYVPLCLYEIAAGPSLHRWLYGYSQLPLDMSQRFGGWRPLVFMPSGLMVALLLAAGSIAASWCWYSGVALPRLGRFGTGLCAITLGLTTVAAKSVNGWIVLAAGIAVLSGTRGRFGAVLAAGLIAVAPLYVLVRVAGVWDGSGIVPAVRSVFGAERAESVEFRLEQERQLRAKAMQKPWFGWGGWGRSHLFDENGKDVTVVDSLWIIALGPYGLTGILGCFAVLVVGPSLLWHRFPLRDWSAPEIAPAAALAVVVSLFAIDCCMNAMINPVYLAAAGGLAGLGSAVPSAPR
jgi:hypothetical protein